MSAQHALSSASSSHRAKRRPVAYIAVISVCLIGAAVSWVSAFRAQPESFPVACSLPQTGLSVSSTELVGQDLAAPKDITVRVLNANGQAGQAGSVSAQLTNMGFAPHPIEPVLNDPIVSTQDMGCFGQLRYSPQFAAHAATVHALFPCFELINDARADGTVDVVLGRGFTDLPDSGSAAAAMDTLNAGQSLEAGVIEGLTGAKCQ